MRTIGNVVWLVLGGFWMGVGWWLAGLLAAVSIIGLPWAQSYFILNKLYFWPFGRDAVDRKALTGRDDLGTGAIGAVANLIWFIVAGVWLAIGHVLSALACFVSIIGIPFGFVHLKLARCALAPVGKTVVEV